MGVIVIEFCSINKIDCAHLAFMDLRGELKRLSVGD
jgi:hypothetical protein